jgi:hypothetical protein
VGQGGHRSPVVRTSVESGFTGWVR